MGSFVFAAILIFLEGLGVVALARQPIEESKRVATPEVVSALLAYWVPLALSTAAIVLGVTTSFLSSVGIGKLGLE